MMLMGNNGEKMKKLTQVSPHTQVEIVDIKADLLLCKRLAELAFLPGEQLFVVANNPSGYVVVESQRGRFGFPREIAEKIYVRELFVQPRFRGQRGYKYRWRGGIER